MKLKVIWALVAVCFTLAMLPAFAGTLPQGMFLQAAVVTTPTGPQINYVVTNPTANTDGTALAVTAITQNRVAYGTCGGTPTAPTMVTQLGNLVGQGAKTTFPTPVLTPGNYCAQAFTTANGIESSPSNVLLSVIQAAAPNPPTLTGSVSVQVADTTVYKRSESVGGWSYVSIGTVPPGTPCSTVHEEDGLRPIAADRSVIAKASAFTVLPLNVFAHCG